MANGFLSKFAPFPRPFWTINTVELFERGAYYGMLFVLSLFMTQSLGIPAEQTGILLAIQFPLLYFLPLLSAALADKVGYKAVLIASFATLIAGYAALAVAADFGGILLGVVLYGVGAGLFKPIPAATVSQTTSEADRNFGFAIYYWLINLGAFIFPLAMQLTFGADFRFFFWVSAALSALNLVICVAFWKNLKAADKSVKVGAALLRLGELAKHPTFIVLLLIYCGFWFMYAMTTSFLPVYLVEFGIIEQSFAPTIGYLNALAIIVLGPFLGKLTGKVPSIPLMVMGISVYVAGFVLLGFAGLLAFALAFVIAGIVIYSTGEFLTHPGFLAYVSKIAPEGRVAVFLSYGFLPIGIGQFLGTLAGGFLYGRYAQRSGQPQLFWAIISSIGLVTIALLLLYNRMMQRRVKAATEEPAPAARRRGFLVGPAAAALALLLIPALVVAGALVPAQAPVQVAGDGGLPDADDLVTLALDPIDGEAVEGDTVEQKVTLPANATGAAIFTITWRDEANQAARQNAPDSFTVHLMAPDGTEAGKAENVPNPTGGEGVIEIKVDRALPGEWTLHVEVASGDQAAGAGPLALPVGSAPDTGNAFTLTVETQAAPA